MDARDHFYALFDALARGLPDDEVLLGYVAGEESDFIRFNHNRVRQAGNVHQAELSLRLVKGMRHAGCRCNLGARMDEDLALLRARLDALRNQCLLLQDDPYLNYNTRVASGEDLRRYAPLDSESAVYDIVAAGRDHDLVGFFANGRLYRGFANSLGQRNWYRTANFNFDWSLYDRADRAVKCAYAGFAWSADVLREKMEAARRSLEMLKSPPIRIPPGRYRVYLAPAALKEILSILCFGGFSLKSHRTRQSPLRKLADDTRRLDPRITLVENRAGGSAPRFTDSGFLAAERVTLIERGRYTDHLADARSAKEFGHAVNAAREYPESLDMGPGDLPLTEVLRTVDRGLYINHLWYTNFSDMNECRMTGMTRFACFQVEGGAITAPIEVMRFDESLYRMLGDHLIALTREREVMFDTDTYARRSLANMHLPGVLLADFSLTL